MAQHTVFALAGPYSPNQSPAASLLGISSAKEENAAVIATLHESLPASAHRR